PSTLTASTSTSATSASGGPARRNASSSSTAGPAPSAWTSTSPSSPLRTQPSAPSLRARLRVASRKPTACTLPRTIALAAVASGSDRTRAPLRSPAIATPGYSTAPGAGLAPGAVLRRETLALFSGVEGGLQLGSPVRRRAVVARADEFEQVVAQHDRRCSGRCRQPRQPVEFGVEQATGSRDRRAAVSGARDRQGRVHEFRAG